MRPLRVVFYAVNGSGLGHVTRLVAIARWMRRLETLLSGTPPELLFLTSTEATSLLSEHRLAAFKLPSKGVARSAGLDVLEHRRLAKHFVWQTIGTMAPDLLVVDTFPHGSFDELLPILDGPFAKVLVLRAVKPEYAQRPVFQASMRLYDRVIVPHAAGSEPALEAQLPAERPASWVGDILNIETSGARNDGPSSRLHQTLRDELGLGDERLVYLSAGGGGDPTTERALTTLVTALADRPDLHLLVGAGPLYRGRRLHGARLTWFDRADVGRFFPAVDAAITAAGYNTFHELLHLGVPSAFFSQDKIADEQHRRIAAASAAGAALALGQLETLQPSELRATIDRLLDNRDIGARARAFVPHNGARLAAAHALSACRRGKGLTPLMAAELLTPRLIATLDAMGDAGEQLLRSGLAQLFPDPALDRLDEQRAIEALLPALSPEARAEVMSALGARTGSDETHALERGLVALCEAAGPTHANQVPTLIEAALKKHPRTQESDPRQAVWVETLLNGLATLMTSPGPLPVPERVALYRAFPRLCDATLAESLAAFATILDHHGHLGVTELQRRFQVLKLGQRRVERQHLQALLQSAPPQAARSGAAP